MFPLPFPQLRSRSISWWRFLAPPIVSIVAAATTAGAADQTAHPFSIRDSAPGAYPWAVALVDAEEQHSALAQYCSGSLIGPRHVLTAAHCAVSASPRDIQVLRPHGALPSDRGNRVDVIGITLHPDFDFASEGNDLALLKLAEPQPGPYLEMISPTEGRLITDGTLATALGWGTTDPDWQSLPGNLQEASVSIRSDAVCLEKLGKIFDPVHEICAGTMNSHSVRNDGIESCYGDSGGPLLVKNSGGIWKQVGVVSWGFGCGEFLAVYAETPANLSFILSFPAAVPTNITPPAVDGSGEVGRALRCTNGEWIGDPVRVYQTRWYIGTRPISWSSPLHDAPLRPVEQPVAQPIALGETFTPSAELAGASVYCGVVASNEGGSSEETFSPDTAITAMADSIPNPRPTAAADAAPPTVTVLESLCLRTQCSVLVNAADDSGVSAISLTVATTRKSCKGLKGRKRTVCRKGRRHIFSAQPLATGLWRASFKKGRTDRVSALVDASDVNGNRISMQLSFDSAR